MGTGVGCRVYVDGTRLPDGCTDDPPEAPAALSGLEVAWGRETTIDQPEPSVCTFDISDPEGGTSFTDVLRVGSTVDVYATGTVWPAPEIPVWPDPGFEAGTAAVIATNATAAVTTERVGDGIHTALRIDPIEDGRRAGVIIAPAPFAAPRDDPAAWDHIVTTAAGQDWTYGARVFAPAGALVRVRPVLFTGPWTAAAQVIDRPLLLAGDGAWHHVGDTFTPARAGAWVGLEISTFPTGPRWDDLAPATTWDDLADPISYAWTGTPHQSASVELSNGTELRRNLALTPTPPADVPFTWTLASELQDVAAVATDTDVRAPSGAPTRRVDRGPGPAQGPRPNSVGGLAMVGAHLGPPGAAVTPGHTYTISLWVLAGVPNLQGFLSAVFYTATGEVVSGAHGPLTIIELPAGWVRLSLTVTAPPQAHSLVIGSVVQLRSGTVTGGERVWFGDAQIEEGPTATPWFFGDSPAAVGGGPSWLDYGGAAFVDDVAILAPADGLEQSVLVYSGRVTDLTSSWPEDEPAPVIRVTCADFTADLDNRVIGDQPWPVEPLADRFARVLALAGGDVTADLDPALAATLVTWRDVDAQPAAGLLVQLAESVDGVLWSATHQTTGPYYELEDPLTRPSLYALAEDGGAVVILPAPGDVARISACDVLRDEVTWSADVGDLFTIAAVLWLEQGTDESGQPMVTERTVTRTDTAGVSAHGSRRISLTTQLQAAGDAAAVADRLLARTSDIDWRADGLVIEDTDLDGGPEDVALLLRLLDGTARNGLPILLTDLRAWAPTGQHEHGVNLEGGTYTFDDGAWVLDLTVSNYAGQGASATWDQLHPAWTWNQLDPAITWDDLRGVGVAEGSTP